VSYRYRELSLQERGELLLVVLILILLGVIFFGTAMLIDRIFPVTPPLVDSWKIVAGQNLSPGAAVFASLALICGVIAVTLFGTALFSTLAFLYIPLFLICLVGVMLFFDSFYNAFAGGGFVYGIAVFGIFAVQVTAIVWTLIKLINWYDSRYGINSYSSIIDSLSRKDADFLLPRVKDRYR
jgi:hypothetical protein